MWFYSFSQNIEYVRADYRALLLTHPNLQNTQIEKFHCTLAPTQTRQKKHKHISQFFLL